VGSLTLPCKLRKVGSLTHLVKGRKVESLISPGKRAGGGKAGRLTSPGKRAEGGKADFTLIIRLIVGHPVLLDLKQKELL